MKLLCTRCSDHATAVMSYNYTASEVWLDDHPEFVDPGTGYAMCDRHADKISPPLGWVLTDRRSPVRLVVTVEVA